MVEVGAVDYDNTCGYHLGTEEEVRPSSQERLMFVHLKRRV